MYMYIIQTCAQNQDTMSKRGTAYVTVFPPASGVKVRSSSLGEILKLVKRSSRKSRRA